MARADGRRADQLRPIKITRGYTESSPGSVLMEMGRTRVLCTVSVEEGVPRWLADADPPVGWVTGEYGMLPGSTGLGSAGPTGERKRRGEDSRSTEIRRLIGRSLRAVTDRERLGPRTLWADCDVIQADGGTRTAAITGAYVALADAVRWLMERGVLKRSPLTGEVAAVSVGMLNGRARLDLDYSEDSRAEVDMNVVMRSGGQFVEVQGTGEQATFTGEQMDSMLELAERGIRKLLAAQRAALR